MTTRDDLGRVLYRALNRDTFVIAWDDLPNDMRERYRVAAELFVKSAELDAFIEQIRRRIAA